jgi:hypothetical protein
LSIDGLQPEKGHETLYVVRELTLKRAWFAEALISSTAAEVRRLFVKARQWAEQLGKPVQLWVSDKQDAFLTGIAAEFPDVPHRYCSNHFVRDLAKPILEADSNAKVKMRSKVRGLRSIESDVLGQHSQAAAPVDGIPNTAVPVPEVSPVVLAEVPSNLPLDAAGQVVLDYCSAVRGVLNSDQGGPLQPPGLRMAEALHEIRDSLQVNLEEKKGAPLMANSNGWPTASTAACPPSRKPSNSFANK